MYTVMGSRLRSKSLTISGVSLDTSSLLIMPETKIARPGFSLFFTALFKFPFCITLECG